MRIPTQLQTLSFAATIALLAGCSGGGTYAIAPKPASQQGGAHFLMGRVPSVLSPIGQLKISNQTSHRFVGHDSCPASGPLKYMSDFNNSVINIYAGKFAGQAPCGQITSGISFPDGLYVKTTTHDLYVANEGGFNILVFHRGQTTAYNSYADPGVQFPVDVTLAKDGTVIASNILQPSGAEAGSLSTWIEGPNGGTFVGNFPMTNDTEGLFVTVQKNGTVYFDDLDVNGSGALWSLSCPAGACGAQTQVAGVSFGGGGGLGSDATEDLLANDQTNVTADTFELPNPSPATFPLTGEPVGMVINKLDHHWFIADAVNNDAGEYLYPSGTLVGTVPGNSGGLPIGVAVDPGHTLK
ncbi:MAG TPA: hypothetical protein VII69_14360 [Candidatus Eremiobacteraceae bacterium]